MIVNARVRGRAQSNGETVMTGTLITVDSDPY